MNETELERTDEKTETDAAQSTETPKEKETAGKRLYIVCGSPYAVAYHLFPRL